MSTIKCPSPLRKISPAMWNTYITEAIQSGHHKYCIEHNILYRTLSNKYKEYQQCTNKENWSPNSKRRYNHRVFTDCTEKQAVEQLTEQYINQQKTCNNNDLSECLLIIHKQ